MFDIGWTELLLIGVVALIVVGPKDLPVMFRTLGRYTGQLRQMAREFQRSMEAAADEAGVKDMANDLRAATDPLKSARSWARDSVMGADGKPKPGTTAAGPAGKPSTGVGPATEALSAERAEAKRRIEAKVAETARARSEAEAVAAAPAEATATDGDNPDSRG